MSSHQTRQSWKGHSVVPQFPNRGLFPRLWIITRLRLRFSPLRILVGMAWGKAQEKIYFRRGWARTSNFGMPNPRRYHVVIPKNLTLEQRCPVFESMKGRRSTPRQRLLLEPRSGREENFARLRNNFLAFFPSRILMSKIQSFLLLA